MRTHEEEQNHESPGGITARGGQRLKPPQRVLTLQRLRNSSTVKPACFKMLWNVPRESALVCMAT